MNILVDDIIVMTVTKVSGYACWGMYEGRIGFVHIVDWSNERPLPESRIPTVGDQMKVKVFRMVSQPQKELPLDVTFGGTVHVDFAASAALLE